MRLRCLLGADTLSSLLASFLGLLLGKRTFSSTFCPLIHLSVTCLFIHSFKMHEPVPAEGKHCGSCEGTQRGGEVWTWSLKS